MVKKRKKSLVGWTNFERYSLMKFDGRHSLAELDICPTYKTKQGVYFHGHATKRSEYLYSPRKVRITIEEL